MNQLACRICGKNITKETKVPGVHNKCASVETFFESLIGDEDVVPELQFVKWIKKMSDKAEHKRSRRFYIQSKENKVPAGTVKIEISQKPLEDRIKIGKGPGEEDKVEEEPKKSGRITFEENTSSSPMNSASFGEVSESLEITHSDIKSED